MGLTLRGIKGSALTHDEGDANFTSFQDTSVVNNGDALIGVKNSSTNSVARTQHDKNEEFVTSTDFASIQDALNTGKNVYVPAGTHTVTSGLYQTADVQKIFGAGMGLTTINYTGAGVSCFIDSPSLSYNKITIEGMNLTGGAGTSSAILFTKLTYVSRFKDLLISSIGNAVHIEDEFSSVFDNVFVSSTTGHGFFVEGGITTTFINCYASTIGTSGKYGYRTYGGGHFIGCNGLDSGSNWGLFGATVANDGVDVAFNCLFDRCNFEAYTDIGTRFIYQGYARFTGGSFIKSSGSYTTSISLETSTSSLKIDGTDFSTSGGTLTKLSDVFTTGANYNVLIEGAPSNLSGIDENGTLRSLPTITSGYVAWTPVLQGASTSGTNTYSVQSGQYRVDGHMVTAWFDLRLSGNTVAMVGSLQIAGLPYVAFNSLTFPGSGYCSDWNNITLFSADYYSIGLVVAGNTSVIALKQSGTNVATGGIDQSAINATTGFIRGCVQYIKK